MYMCIYLNIYLVGGLNPLQKYEFVNGKDDISYMKWTIKIMFETTNQDIIFVFDCWIMVYTPMIDK